jgi:lipopolysaccharide transport system ATP-binding protein
VRSFLTLDNVSVEFPIFGAHATSLKTTLASAATGGRIGVNTGVTVVQALRNVTLHLQEGDRLGLVGHNGAGKSTLLQTLAGVYPPTSGTYRRHGTIASLVNPLLGIELDASGYENILIRGLVLGIDRRTIRRAMPDIAEFSGLGDYLAMPVRTYSTGMMMRLAFSIVTSIRTDILLMDEWLSVGDEQFQRQAESRLRDVVANAGILVLASHSRALIEKECRTVMELQHGVAAGPPLPLQPVLDDAAGGPVRSRDQEFAHGPPAQTP